ncbi:MAG: 6-phosphofructokinase [Candidatus Hydrothermota bacterium]|nr:MAG: 6-phosphofructokinase [Candidatus Hydrothermae bacterium]
MRIGVLTGGGDAPGLNSAIRGIVFRAHKKGHEVIGILRGWRGLIEQQARPLSLDEVEEIHREGGTVILTSRTNPLKSEETAAKALEGFKALGLDGLIAIGGEDTLGACAKLAHKGLRAIGIPKTIDHDVPGTEFTIGFDTAIEIVTEALDRLVTTAKSHERVIVVEIMGRHAGWMALFGGLAGGAHFIVIPEQKVDVDEIIASIRRRFEAGKRYALVAVAEGVTFFAPKASDEVIDEFGHVKVGGVAEYIANAIKKAGFEARHVVLGHLQRGGSPSVRDRLIPMLLGVKAVELVEKGEFGKMVTIRGEQIITVPLDVVTEGIRAVPPELYEIAKAFFA